MKKNCIIEKCFNEKKVIYLNRVYRIKNKFYHDFYLQCINSIVADSYDFFLDTPVKSNVFKKNAFKMTDTMCSRFFKIMSMHHTIKFIKKYHKEINKTDIEKALFYVFDFDDNEKLLFEILCEAIFIGRLKFRFVINKIMIKYVFNMNNFSLQTLAFVENFFFYSYRNFTIYLTKYVCIKNQLENISL